MDDTDKTIVKIHINFAGPYHNQYFFIMVVSYSRWPELFIVNNTTSAVVIRLLRTVFSIQGLYEILVSDNGTRFVAREMEQFLQANYINIHYITTAPYHPATNGLPEKRRKPLRINCERPMI